MPTHKLNQSNWQIVEEEFQLENALVNETLFALGNGYLGLRGTFEEGLGYGSVEGTYINGFYESAPIVYGEKFQGYAENKQTILNLANAKVIRLTLGDEPFTLLNGKILDYHRELDLKHGILRRMLRWESPQGKQIQLKIERMALHTRPHVAAIRYQFIPLNFDGSVTVTSIIDGAISQSEHAEDDPRLGTTFSGQVLRLEKRAVIGETAWMAHRTVTTQFSVASGIRHSINTPCTTEVIQDEHSIGFAYQFNAQQGSPIILDKMMAYVTSRDTDEAQIVPSMQRELEQAVVTGFEHLKDEQQNYMAAFWDKADIQIEGDDQLQRGIRFNLFHLLQSTGKDGRTNIAAKGLTGLGYEGHYFWDTEIYILPFFLYTQPEISRRLLEYRYHILDKARQRARQMAHPQGALYAWRTINGEECSANFPTGTAQYHINADIAFAIRRYYDATGDADFMKRYGIEILCETARLWRNVGAYIPGYENRFCINSVTGPDEYQILVNNNAYTNLMARENLHFAAEMIDWLRQSDMATYEALTTRIMLEDIEPSEWHKAAKSMYIPYDEKLGIIPQDDGFLHKAVWDFEHTPKENYPLLLHYHPLVVMRYQVCKQADLVLAEFLLHDQFEQAQKQRDFAFYERITTHDSSLSGAIFGIMAAELGDTNKAFQYFEETATMDLENKHGNTQAGIHAANMAGVWQGIVFGFAGMRAKNGLSFKPVIPSQWQAYAFKVQYQGRAIGARVTQNGATFTLLSGEPLEIMVDSKSLRLEN